MRESFIFYDSFLNALDELDSEIRLQVYDAICHYALREEEPELSGIAKAIFLLIKPQIDANNKKYESGKKGANYGKLGGRPKKEKPLKNPLGVISENPKETPNVNVNENDNVNVNVNVNENVVEEVEEEKLKNFDNFYGEFKNVYLSSDRYDALKGIILNDNVLSELIDELSTKIAEKSDKYKPYDEKFPNAHFSYLRNFWKFRQNNPQKFNAVISNNDEFTAALKRGAEMYKEYKAKKEAQNEFK